MSSQSYLTLGVIIGLVGGVALTILCAWVWVAIDESRQDACADRDGAAE